MVLPKLPRDAGDRNRTSPFAFTGNKFEFRAVSSNQSIAYPNIALNMAVTESLDYMATELEKAVKGGKKIEAAVADLLPKVIKENKRIIFNGNNYSAEWEKEAGKRGLLNLKNTVDALPQLVTKEVIGLFEKYKVLNERELHARYEVMVETYNKTVNVEGQLMVLMANRYILPAAFEYQKQVAQSVAAVKAAGAKSVEGKKTLDGLVKLIDEFKRRADKLQKVLEHEGDGVGGEARQAFPRRGDSGDGGAPQRRRRARADHPARALAAGDLSGDAVHQVATSGASGASGRTCAGPAEAQDQLHTGCDCRARRAIAAPFLFVAFRLSWYVADRMAKRKPPEQSLFDNIDAPDPTGSADAGSGAQTGAGAPARDAAVRASLIAGGGNGAGTTDAVPLHEAAQSRYLNYALSVITARALPDVRDGLKPVQRRILYTMWQQNLTADVKHRKCAKVVGDVMGSFHPHGDVALYETLVRMAQPFSLRYPLVDGSGNFGSLDGDSAAAMRYTECRLAPISNEMLAEIEQTTVPFRPNYDGTKTEPVVLPARVPNLLVNGTTGIAVGMATNIPPHNLGEVCTALLKLLDNEDIGIAQLCRYIKGPDFPTGGQILNSPEELRADLQDRVRIDPAARHLGHRPGDPVDQDDLRRQRPLHGQQVAADRADRRGRAEPQAAAAARREGPVDRGRAHRHRDEEGRRREDDHGVSLQAHAAAGQLRRQPDLPDPDREPRGRAARSARSQADPLALPALPARGRDQAPRARAGIAQQAHPHPRRASRRSSTRSTRSSG